MTFLSGGDSLRIDGEMGDLENFRTPRVRGVRQISRHLPKSWRMFVAPIPHSIQAWASEGCICSLIAGPICHSHYPSHVSKWPCVLLSSRVSKSTVSALGHGLYNPSRPGGGLGRPACMICVYDRVLNAET